MNSQKSTDYYPDSARHLPHTLPVIAHAAGISPEAIGKIERLHAKTAKANNGDRTPGQEAFFQLLPHLNRASNNSQGFLLTDTAFKPLYSNDCAASILSFSSEVKPATRESIARQIRTILQCDRCSRGVGAAEFVSGKRLYVCRPFLLESRNRTVRRPMVILLLERCVRDPLPLSQMSREFHLSPRECETVRYLSQGLTTKEVAGHMRVSPNTVKQFVRLIMSKMGVTTRSGIVGKLVAG